MLKMETKQVTISHLEEVANEFLEENFNLSLNVPIRISKRMTSTFGSFIRTINNFTGITKEKEIVLSYNLIKYQSYETTIDVLKHECVHYALFKLDKPFKDGQVYFENTLRRLGVSSTRTYAYKGKAHLYSCSDCSNSFTQKRKFDTSRYHCGKCKGSLRYIKEIILK